jgi:hypothetical protein
MHGAHKAVWLVVWGGREELFVTEVTGDRWRQE